MLSSETKQKINNCRDYLVGKIPDPKGQIEQITNALIYKFMSDQDALSQELWGQASFFIWEYEDYDWPKLFETTKTNEQRAELYIKGIEKLSWAKHLPGLFREIFKDAYIPFRAPNTIVLFLSEINKFDYHHSEELGNAFEYLLQIMGSQGNAGQFRTPRHIIEFLVDLVDPQLDDTIYDPACGTAGFLISAYKHILENNTLTPSQKIQLSKNISGVDIDPGMAKIARVNLFLHEFKSPIINEWDTLSDKPLWWKKYDVILANPPFMTPRGGIKVHDGYTINSTKAEVLFTSYIAQHLKLGWRAGIIVPEGIIFQAATAYKKLRKMLIEEKLLYAVVSLPWGIFQPYSGVKTSILLLDRNLAAKSDKILFAKIQNDGFSMSTQRKAHDRNDLPEVLTEIQNYKTSLENNTEFETINQNIFAVEISKIVEDEEYNLSFEKNRTSEIVSISEFEYVKLESICTIQNGYAFDSKLFNESEWFPLIRIRNVKKNYTDTLYSGDFSDDFIVKNNDLIIWMDWEFNHTLWQWWDALLNQRVCRLNDLDKTTKQYINFIIGKELKRIEKNTFAVTVKHLSSKTIKEIKVPLPPLDIQKQIVDELDSYQKIIDGAKQIVENYKPTIKIDESWEMVELGEVCKLLVWYAFSSKDFTDSWIQVIKMSNVKERFFDQKNNPSYITTNSINDYEKYKLSKGDIIISMTWTIWKEDYWNVCKVSEWSFLLNQRVGKFNIISEKLDSDFLYLLAWQQTFKKQIFSLSSGWVRQSNISWKSIEKIKIPLPTIEIQKEIVIEIEREQSFVDGAKELIKIYEKKIEDKVNEIWGE